MIIYPILGQFFQQFYEINDNDHNHGNEFCFILFSELQPLIFRILIFF